MEETKRYEVIVVGAGPAGLACALGFAHEGIETLLLAGPHRPSGTTGKDRRTAALFGCSIDLLRNLGVFDALQSAGAPIRGIRLIDDTERLFRAPEVVFSSDDIGVEAFGYNVPQVPLVGALWDRCGELRDRLSIVETQGVVSVDVDRVRAKVGTAEGASFEAPLVAAADGRNSVCRGAVGIEVSSRRYPQCALVTTFSHERSHDEISTEFHRAAGPFTVVPMPGHQSSLVWVERPQVAERLLHAGESKFVKMLETRLQGLLGDVGEMSKRAVFPLSSMVAKDMAARRVALVGESGHAIPPIGAQGLNLGLHDGAALVDIVREAKVAGEDLGADSIMRAYNRIRWLDVHGRVGVVDALNSSLISGMEPLQFVRGAGLHVLNVVGPLRRMVLKSGLRPLHVLPRLMRSTRSQAGGGAQVA